MNKPDNEQSPYDPRFPPGLGSWRKPLKSEANETGFNRRTLFRTFTLGVSALLVGNIPDFPDLRFSLRTDDIDRRERTTRALIREGFATEEDERARQRAIDESIRIYRRYMNPRIINEYRVFEIEEIFGLRDIHDLRTKDLLEKGRYAIPIQVRVYDTRTRPNKTLGSSLLIWFNSSEQVDSFELDVFPGGAYQIDEVSSRGMMKSNREFSGNFGYVPEERRLEVASSLLVLPADIKWGYKKLTYPYSDPEFILAGNFVYPKGEIGELTYDFFNELPKLKVILIGEKYEKQ